MKFSLLCAAAAQLAGASTVSPSWRDATKDSASSATSLTTANSTTSIQGKKAFSLYQVPSPNGPGLHVPSGVIKAHAKFNGTLTPELRKAIETDPDLHSKFKSMVSKDGTETSVPAYPAPFDSQYVVPVEVGTPPQLIYMNLDTGSADFWVFSTDTYLPQRDGHTVYHPDDSSTSEFLPGESWVVKYGDSTGASGNVYTDVVRLGELSYSNQSIQSAINVSPRIAEDEFSSGILGLASGTANTVLPHPQKTYLQNIKDELSMPLFTANLRRDVPGNYNFGYINETEYTGNITYTDINPQAPYWMIHVDGYGIGSNNSNSSNDSSDDSSEFRDHVWTTIVDTGTSQLLMPQPIVNDYYSQVDGAAIDERRGMVVFPCDAELPDFTFGIGEYRGRVPGRYVNYGHADDTHCYGGIQSSRGIPFGVLGDVLLKAQFVVFDLGSARVGFANKDLEE